MGPHVNWTSLQPHTSVPMKATGFSTKEKHYIDRDTTVCKGTVALYIEILLYSTITVGSWYAAEEKGTAAVSRHLSFLLRTNNRIVFTSWEQRRPRRRRRRRRRRRMRPRPRRRQKKG